MTFTELTEFLENRMRQSHVYQPVLIRALIDSGGSATVRQLATIFVQQDESQLLYYERTIKSMPVKVLEKHGVVTKNGDLISLSVGRLTLQQRAEIRRLCETKLQEFIAKKGIKIWDYRMLDFSGVADELRSGAFGCVCRIGDNRVLHRQTAAPRRPNRPSHRYRSQSSAQPKCVIALFADHPTLERQASSI